MDSQVKESLEGTNRNCVCFYVPLKSLEQFTRTEQKRLPDGMWGRVGVESGNREDGREQVGCVTFH